MANYPFNGRVSEGYVHQRVELHIHTGGLVSKFVGLVASNLCLMFVRFQTFDEMEIFNDNAKVHRVADSCASVRSESEIESSVFVNVVQFLQEPEPMFHGIRSLVRLQSLNDCLRLWVDAPDPVRAAILKAFPKSKDRELRVSDVAKRKWTAYRRSMVRDRQAIENVIEDTTKVVNRVASDDGDVGWWRTDPFYANDILSSVRVDLVGDEIRVLGQPPMDFEFQGLQVLVRTL